MRGLRSLLALSLISGLAFSSQGGARIAGDVTGPSGRPLPGATVSLARLDGELVAGVAIAA